MNPFLTISRTELQRHPEAEPQLSALSEKVKEFKHVTIYSSPMIKMTDLICFLKDSGVHFAFYTSIEELKPIFIKSANETD
ncbi:MAG: hypothetical protein WD824_24740 [Cyclobacteriaceae bacterium]